MGWSTTVAATGTTRGSAAMMREAISGLLLANLRGGFALPKASLACSSITSWPNAHLCRVVVFALGVCVLNASNHPIFPGCHVQKERIDLI